MKPFHLLYLTALLAFSASGCTKTAPESGEPEKEDPLPIVVSVAKARLQDISETVSAQGTLSPIQGGSGHVSAPLSGRLQSVLVREGDRVVQGQCVATLDTRSQAAQALSAKAAFRAATATARQTEISASAAASDQTSTLELARLALATAIADNDAALQNARTARDLARIDLDRINAGPRPEEIVQAQDTLKQAEATRARAETENKRQQLLYEKGVSARRLVEDAATALAVAESAVENAGQNLALVKAGARPEDRAAVRLRVQQTEEALQQAKVSGAAKIALARATLTQAEQAVLQVVAKRQEAQAAKENATRSAADYSVATVQAGYSNLLAPLSGTITRRNLNPGDIADSTTPVLEIVNLTALDLIGSLSAADGESVRAGMQARITLPDAPNLPAREARVLNVGVIDPTTNLLSVRLRVSNPGRTLKPGTFATARIVVRTVRQVVTVPREALLTREGKSLLFVVSDGVAHQIPVTAGVEQEDQVRVTGNIHAGDTVVRLGQYELEDGAKVTVEAQ